MFERAGLLYLYVETPLHAGSGTSLGVVDLPIQRERITGYPLIQGSGLKGSLRAVAEQRDRAKARLVFGPDTTQAHEHAGALSVGDARILLFPVRSLIGVFAWVTSQNVLARFWRDATMVGISLDWQPVGPTGESEALVGPSSTVVSNNRLVLEEFAFAARPSSGVQRIAEWLRENALPTGEEYTYWRDVLPGRLVVLPENAFRDFVQFSTEIISRIRLHDEKRTVERGALWSEEHLPSETLLYAGLFASRPRVARDTLPAEWQSAVDPAQQVLAFVRECVDGRRLQLGGDSTVGRGLVKIRLGGVS